MEGGARPHTFWISGAVNAIGNLSASYVITAQPRRHSGGDGPLLRVSATGTGS